MAPLETKSREKLTIRQVPQKVDNDEENVLKDFGKLIFSPGPFPSGDEINFNDGLEANPFDKIAKVYGRHKDVFQFNSVLRNHQTRARILEIAEKKCDGLENQVGLLNQFKKRMNIYLKRIGEGREDALEALGVGDGDGGVEGFFHGYHVAQRNIARNIHANLNINVTTDGQQLETKKILYDIKTARMEEEECSRLERMKIYGNGKRIMNVVKGSNGQRNYSFSKLAKMDLEIEWICKDDKAGVEAVCQLVLEINGGRVGVKMASIGEEEEHGILTAAMFAKIREAVKQNKEVLVGNKNLSMILEEIENISKKVEVVEGVSTMKATTSGTASGNNKFDCRSQEKLIIVRVAAGKPKSMDNPLENSDFKEILRTIQKLDFTCAGPFDPDDTLNYNDGRGDVNPFNKVSKYYGRQKNIFVLIDYLCNDTTKNEIMNVVRQKYGGGDDEESVQKILEFEQRIDLFLERVEKGKQLAMEFLGEVDARDVVAFFAGPRNPSGNSPEGNICANLNMDLLEKNAKEFLISDYFTRAIPPGMDDTTTTLDNGELVRVKIFGNGKKIVTASKNGMDDPGQRNYLFTRFAEMELKIEWKAVEKGDSDNENGENERNCLVVLRVGIGNVDRITLSKATLDGEPVGAADIAGFVKQNDKVFLRNKSLYEVIYPKSKDKSKQDSGRKKYGTTDDKDGFIVLDDEMMETEVVFPSASGGGGDGAAETEN